MSLSTDSQNHSKSFVAFLDNSSKDVILYFCIKEKMFEDLICSSVGIKAKSDITDYLI